jgi:hypothetical protein
MVKEVLIMMNLMNDHSELDLDNDEFWGEFWKEDVFQDIPLESVEDRYNRLETFNTGIELPILTNEEKLVCIRKLKKNPFDIEGLSSKQKIWIDHFYINDEEEILKLIRKEKIRLLNGS